MLSSRVGYHQLRHLKWLFSKLPKIEIFEKISETIAEARKPTVSSSSIPKIKLEPSWQKSPSSIQKPDMDSAILAQKNVVFIGGFSDLNFQCCKLLVSAGVKHLSILEVTYDKNLFEEVEMYTPQDSCVHFMPLNPLDGPKAIAAALRRANKRMDGIDILINGSDMINEENPRTCIQHNLLAPIFTTIAATPLMSCSEGARGGLIVNISSVFGLEPASCLATYSATKHGVIAFTRACSHEHYYNQTGIGHMAVCVGFTQTELFDNLESFGSFSYSLAIIEDMQKIKKQPLDACAENIVKAIQSGEVGTIWMLNNGKLEKVTMPSYWEGDFTPSTDHKTVTKLIEDFA